MQILQPLPIKNNLSQGSHCLGRLVQRGLAVLRFYMWTMVTRGLCPGMLSTHMVKYSLPWFLQEKKGKKINRILTKTDMYIMILSFSNRKLN